MEISRTNTPDGYEVIQYKETFGVRDEWGDIVPRVVYSYETRLNGHRVFSFLDHEGLVFPKKFVGGAPVDVWGEPFYARRLYQVYPIPFQPGTVEYNEYTNAIWWCSGPFYVNGLERAKALSQFLWERKPQS